jgi:hypothetical protein
MDLQKIGWKAEDWIHLTQGRDWWQTLVNSDEPLDCIKDRELLDWVTVSF